MSKPSTAIQCTACGAESWVVREPIYEGFTKVGESFACASCGHVFASEEDVPYVGLTTPKIFSEEDRSAQPQLFEAGENRRICRYCKHYVVNPFTQWCGVHKKEVEATDSCGRFEARSEE